MKTQGLIISPSTRVGELLDSYPQLEEILLEMSPVFAKLRNPVLRRTVARVATLQQVAVVGGLKMEDLINRLRKAAGQDLTELKSSPDGNMDMDVPAWFSPEQISIRFNATPVINRGESPMAEILRLAGKLNKGEILELKTPFIPAPVLEKLKELGFSVYINQGEEEVHSYIRR